MLCMEDGYCARFSRVNAECRRVRAAADTDGSCSCAVVQKATPLRMHMHISNNIALRVECLALVACRCDLVVLILLRVGVDNLISYDMEGCCHVVMGRCDY